MIELLVALALLATITSIVGLAFLRSKMTLNPDAMSRAAAARRAAIDAGKPIPFIADSASERRRAIAMPDGSVLGSGSAGIDRASGRPVDVSR